MNAIQAPNRKLELEVELYTTYNNFFIEVLIKKLKYFLNHCC